MDYAVIHVAVAARAYPGEVVNGDLCSVQRDRYACRIAVIDGLGHGEEAAVAARAADAALAAHPTLPPAEALLACHRALQGTRGAAITIAAIDLERADLTYAGVGNVEGRLWQECREQRLMIHRGIVGKTMPRLRPVTLALAGDWMLLMHTDGVSARFTLPRDALLAGGTPEDLAERLLWEWGRERDDATVMIACAAQTAAPGDP